MSAPKCHTCGDDGWFYYHACNGDPAQCEKQCPLQVQCGACPDDDVEQRAAALELADDPDYHGGRL